MTTLNYKKLTASDMITYAKENDPQKKKINLRDYIENGSFKLMKAKKPFYEAFKDADNITWEDAPREKVAKMTAVELLDELGY